MADSSALFDLIKNATVSRGYEGREGPMKCPPYGLTTGVMAGLEKDYIKTVTVVTTDVIDKFGMVTDRAALDAIRTEITQGQKDTNAPAIMIFVRAKIND